MFALFFALLSLSPAPNGTQFKTEKGEKFEVVGVVKEPFDPIIPARVYDTSGFNPREVGWAWKQTFQDWGVKHVNVCRNQKGEIYLFPPYSVWMRQTK